MLKNKAFIATEALISFVVFSIILILYLPGYYQGISQLKKSQKECDQWRIFSDLVQIQTDSNQENLQNRLDLAKAYYEAGSHESVVGFECGSDYCWIEFSSGQMYLVSLEEVLYE